MPTFSCWAIAAPASIPLPILAADCIAGIFPESKEGHILTPPFFILIAAHSKAFGIDAIIRTVRIQIRTRYRMLVVANNGATIARVTDADAVEPWFFLSREIPSASSQPSRRALSTIETIHLPPPYKKQTKSWVRTSRTS